MIYKKDPNVRYTDMCIYIDDHIYNGDYDERLVYEYLYPLTAMLASKKKFFTTATDYDDFGLYCATRLMLRLVDKRQFLEDGNPKKLDKVDSILNFIKATLYPMKVDYQREYFAQSFEDTSADIFDRDSIKGRLLSQSVDSERGMVRAEFEYYLMKISSTVKNFLKDSPYSCDKRLMHGIYLSCMLTILSQVTLNNSVKTRLKNRQRAIRDEYIDDLYQQEIDDSLILYHCPDTLSNYILVLVNKIKKLICKDLEQLIDSYQMPDAIIKSILQSPLSEVAQS